jgi:hypothetical protein
MEDIRREPPDRALHTEDLAERAEQAERERRDRPAAYEEPPREPEGREPLFSPEAADSFRAEWIDIQTGFVDEPRVAVERADALVARVIKSVAEIFADERAGLERQWDRGDQISTEDLRVALRRYRSFFDRLLTV